LRPEVSTHPSGCSSRSRQQRLLLRGRWTTTSTTRWIAPGRGRGRYVRQKRRLSRDDDGHGLLRRPISQIRKTFQGQSTGSCSNRQVHVTAVECGSCCPVGPVDRCRCSLVTKPWHSVASEPARARGLLILRGSPLQNQKRKPKLCNCCCCCENHDDTDHNHNLTPLYSPPTT
jgi:hypothetical protein